MNLEQALEQLNAAVLAHKGRNLNLLEKTILKGSWESKTYKEMAQASEEFSLNYLQNDAGPELWKLLTEVLGEEVNKRNFRHLHLIAGQKLTTQQISSTHQKLSSIDPSIGRKQTHQQQEDWGDAPDVSGFYGRTEELENLRTWIVEDKCNLVSITGLIEMGKTFLASKLAEEIKDEFDYVIWRSLGNDPPLLEYLLDDLFSFFLAPTDIPQELKDKISKLMEFFRTHKCLLILNGIETILRHEDISGNYKEEYNDYGKLIRRIGEERHQSCLVLTGWENPIEVRQSQNPSGPVRLLKLTGIKLEEAREKLHQEGLSGKDQEWEWLINNCCGGKPSKLKLISQKIKDIFEGKIAKYYQYTQQPTITIKKHYQRLSQLEKDIVTYLAKQEREVSFNDLVKNIKGTKVSSSSPLIEAIQSLIDRAIIKSNKGRFKAINTIKKYLS